MLGHHAQLMLYRLKLAERLAELNTVVAILQRHLENTVHGTAQQRRMQRSSKDRQHGAAVLNTGRAAVIRPRQCCRQTVLNSRGHALR